MVGVAAARMTKCASSLQHRVLAQVLAHGREYIRAVRSMSSQPTTHPCGGSAGALAQSLWRRMAVVTHSRW
jgi:hypothetical protein